jgi:MoxR-like ATPase
MTVPNGTFVRVELNDNNEVWAVGFDSRPVFEVPAELILKAYESSKCIQKIGDGEWKLRNHKEWDKALEEYKKSLEPVDSAAHPIKIDSDGMFDIPTEHSEIVQFIKNSYSLKPARLKIDELRWRFATRAILRGENLLIRGDAGCGKTMLAHALKDVFKRPFFYFNLGATQDARSTLIGNTHFKKEQGTYVSEALFVKAIQTTNAIILLDELTRAHPDAHNILMSVVDQRQRYLRIDEHPDSPTINVAKGVTFLATANVGSEYTATRTMDRAFSDRWTTIMMDNLSLEQEKELLTEMFPQVDPFDIDAIAQIADQTRQDVKDVRSRFSTIISTRVTTELVSLLYDGFTLSEAAQVKIYPLYSDAGGETSERTQVAQIVQQFVRDPATMLANDPFANGDPNSGRAKPWV